MGGSLGDFAVPHETRDRTDQGAENSTQHGRRLKEGSAKENPPEHGPHHPGRGIQGRHHRGGRFRRTVCHIVGKRIPGLPPCQGV